MNKNNSNNYFPDFSEFNNSNMSSIKQEFNGIKLVRFKGAYCVKPHTSKS